jgi:F-type H+-transporting ATPase subunit gamma
MAELQSIKRQIRSVSSTRQITKAMQLVAASKLRKYQEAALLPQVYGRAAEELLSHLGGSLEARQHPLYDQRTVKQTLTIVVAGDRTLAGPYNSNVFRAFGNHLDNLGVPQQAIAVGRQAGHRIARAAGIEEIAAYTIDSGEGDVELAQPILQEITDLFERSEIDAVHIIYTKFHTTVKQEVVVSQLLPVIPPTSAATPSELEPSPEILIDIATRHLLEAQILQAILESRASEQAARMLAMMNATDNADDLIKDYTLAYNNARQANITQELAEITAGSEAING